MTSLEKPGRFSTVSALFLCALMALQPLRACAEESQAAQTHEVKPAETAEPPKTAESAKPGDESVVDPFSAIGNSAPESPGGEGSVATGSGVSLSNKDVSEVTYDQRQNGTQNVRIHLDDVTLIVAPSDGIMSLFAGQAHHAFIQNGEQGASAQASNASSIKGQDAAGNNDPFAEFDELVSTANFLKSHGGGSPGAAAAKKCAGGRCKGKRTRLSLTRYLLPILAPSHPNSQNEVEQQPRPIGAQ